MKERLTDEKIKKDLINLRLKAISIIMTFIIFLIIFAAIFMQLNVGIIVEINTVLIVILDLFIVVHLTTIQIIKKGEYYVVLECRIIDTKNEVGAEWLKETTGVEIEEVFLDPGEGSKLFFDGGFSASLRLMGKVTSSRYAHVRDDSVGFETLNSPGKVFYLVCKSKGSVVSKNPIFIYPKSLFNYVGDSLIAKKIR